jgi:hypothetical protein
MCQTPVPAPRKSELYRLQKGAVGLQEDSDETSDHYEFEDLTIIDNLDITQIEGEISCLETAVCADAIKAKVSSIDWERSDIYSLGATMCHILTSKRPRYYSNGGLIVDTSEMGQHTHSDETTVYTSCLSLINRSTHPAPKDRFASSTELSRAINDLRAITNNLANGSHNV